MSLTTLPSAIRSVIAANRPPRLVRGFHASKHREASVLFALAALSNSRETQHFNKLTRLSRVEHSPPLKLIKSSEVDPFPCPNPPPRPLIRPLAPSRSAVRVWDQKALQIGRVVLADQARRAHRLAKSLARAKQREAKQDGLVRRERAAWRQERERMRREMRNAGIWILASISTATALAMWRFWPARESGPDSADLGRKIAARAAAAMPLPPAVSMESTISAPIAVPVHSAPAAQSVSPKMVEKPRKAVPTDRPASPWWRNLFWKQN